MSGLERIVHDHAPTEAPEDLNKELTHDEWGNGMIYISHEGRKEEWIGYDPDTMVEVRR